MDVFIGITLEGPLAAALEKRVQAGFTKTAVIKTALWEYLKPNEAKTES